MYISFFIATIIGWCLDWTTFQHRNRNKMIDRLRNFKLQPVWIRHCRWKSIEYDLHPMIDMWNDHLYYWMKTISTDIWKTFCNSFFLMWFIWWSCVRTRHLRRTFQYQGEDRKVWTTTIGGPNASQNPNVHPSSDMIDDEEEQDIEHPWRYVTSVYYNISRSIPREMSVEGQIDKNEC